MDFDEAAAVVGRCLIAVTDLGPVAAVEGLGPDEAGVAGAKMSSRGLPLGTSLSGAGTLIPFFFASAEVRVEAKLPAARRA